MRITVSIPMINTEFKATFKVNLNLKELKLELLKKIANYGVTNCQPECYYLSISGLALLDDAVCIAQVVREDDVLELKRPFHYQITGGQSFRKSVIIEEVDTVKGAIETLARSAFYGLSSKSYNFLLSCSRAGSPLVEMGPDVPFVSHCLRTGDNLEISAHPKEGKEGVSSTLIIEYSPYDALDQQKRLLSKSGYIWKQGGAQGGARNWQRRWFVLGDDQLLYFEHPKAKIPKGNLNVDDILEVKDVTQNIQAIKDDKENFYLSINTADRALLLRFSRLSELNVWKESVREYSELVQVEDIQARGNKALLDPNNPERKKPKALKRTRTNRFRFKKDEEEQLVVSVPFMARKALSLNADFHWSSSDSPKETFDFIEELGVGASGRVIKAKHKKIQNFFIAVKIVPCTDIIVQQEIEKEMEILQTCRSDNIIAYYGCVLRTQDTWILMDYCGAGSVKDVMKVTNECLDEKQLQYVVQGTLKGLSYLHGKGILHLDIKAANILLTDEGIVKLADFGVSQVLKNAGDIVEQDDFVGSPLYMSPEVIMKKGYNDRTDVWSLGITIIEMAQGRPANTDLRTMEDLIKIVERPPPTFKQPRDWSPPCVAFLAKCLEKKPAERPTCLALLMEPFMHEINSPKVLYDLLQQSLDFAKATRVPITEQNRVL